MVKNFLIFVLVLIITCFITLVVSGRLQWVSQEDMINGAPEVVLEST